MRATENKTAVGRLLGFFIVALVIGGMAFLPAVADFDQGSGIMAILFIAFLGAILAVQVIPGMMLFGMMIKAVAGLFRKEEVSKEAE